VYKDLLAQTPLLALPLGALFLFLAVFAFVVIRALTHARRDVALAAHLPLVDDEDHHDV
jgi:hypothetical protein